MVELSAGVASAFIAAGIAALQFILPNALALVLASNLSNSHSAVTWSVVSRFLLSSDWPLFLRSDTTASATVDRKISLLVWTKPLGLILLAAAAVVTPLGLYDGLFATDSRQSVVFVYAPDTGAIGSGTPERNTELGFSRVCWGLLCPQEPNLGNVTFMQYVNETFSLPVSSQINTPWLPQTLVDTYQSGIGDHEESLSGFFDVQFRQWSTSTSNTTANNASFLVASPKTLTSLLLDNKYDLVEGLIADFKDGGIGFRNHSVPTGLQYGAEWEEDILWWTPDVQCVDSNVSLAVAVADSFSFRTQRLIDKGGFANVNKTDPFPDDVYPFAEGQSRPSLHERAYYAAWGMNVLNMQYLNITTPGTNLSRISSSIGQKFDVNSTFISFSTSEFDTLQRTINLGSVVDVPFSFNSNTTNDLIPNPHNITVEMFDDHLLYCRGTGGGNKVNISSINVEIGVIAAPGHNTDTPPTNDITVSGSTWERSVYVCAAATKASIKTVRFKYNTTSDNSLAGLEVVDLKNKHYEDDSQLPLWGFESPTPAWNLSDINPLWGFINPSLAKSPNLSAIRAAHFYIPAGAEAVTGMGIPSDRSSGDNMPATMAPAMLLSSTMGQTFFGSEQEYSGQNDQSLIMVWQDLLRNSTGTEKALRLIWTDLATNFVTGTKGLHTTRHKQPPNPDGVTKRQAGAASTTGQFPVHIFQRHIRYQWIYAIPAMISISLIGIVVFLAFILMICGGGNVARLRYYMFSITPGRILASFVYPAEAGHSNQVETKEWIRVVGYKPVQIRGLAGAFGSGVHLVDRLDQKAGSQVGYSQVQQQEDSDSI